MCVGNHVRAASVTHNNTSSHSTTTIPAVNSKYAMAASDAVTEQYAAAMDEAIAAAAAAEAKVAQLEAEVAQQREQVEQMRPFYDATWTAITNKWIRMAEDSFDEDEDTFVTFTHFRDGDRGNYTGDNAVTMSAREFLAGPEYDVGQFAGQGRPSGGPSAAGPVGVDVRLTWAEVIFIHENRALFAARMEGVPMFTRVE
eukprot:COSAG04_NODE_104_length_26097_cov_12.466074_20_plen_199_part_00